MKVDTKPNVVSGNMVGERTAMGVAVEDMPHIMSILAGLYSRQLLAMVREYSTNAWDAHVEAGVSLPIEVTLPSTLDPNLRIRDYGVGLSAEDIRTIYSQYGRSTKRHTNDQVGMLGVGCKSALAYTNQFTVESIKNGRKITVLVALDEDDAGYTMTLADVPTNDAAGTLVTVPIRREDIAECGNEARDFFSYWSPGSVLLNGKEPARFEGLKLSDTLYLVEGDPSESRIVMGNVPYPHTIDVGVKKTWRDPSVALVAFVPIGTVKPVPSREALKDVQLTRDTVERIKREYKENVKGVIQREIDAAPDPQSAIQVFVKWRRFVPDADKQVYQYRGEALPARFKSQRPPRTNNYGQVIPSTFEITHASQYYGSKTFVSGGDVHIEDAAVTVWVTDYEPEKFTAPHKNKLVKWADDQNLYVKQFVLLREPVPQSMFIPKNMIVPWTTIKAIKLRQTSRAIDSGRIPGSYDIYTEDGGKMGVPGDDLRQDEPLLWVKGNYRDCGFYTRALKLLIPKFTLVCLSANRIDKFMRNAPKAQPVLQALETAFKAWQTKIDPLDLEALAMRNDGMASNYSGMDATRVDDPAFKRTIALAERDVSKITDMQSAVRYILADDLSMPKLTNPARNYPLFQRLNRKHDHTYIYLNHIYALRQQGSKI